MIISPEWLYSSSWMQLYRMLYMWHYTLKALIIICLTAVCLFIYIKRIDCIERTDINLAAGVQETRKLVTSSFSSRLSDDVSWTSWLLQCSVITATTSANVPYRYVNIHQPSRNEDNVRHITIIVRAEDLCIHAVVSAYLLELRAPIELDIVSVSSVTVCIDRRLDVGLFSCQGSRHQSDIGLHRSFAYYVRNLPFFAV